MYNIWFFDKQLSFGRKAFNIQSGSEKTGLYLRVDNFVTVSDKKACDMLEAFKFSLENV